MYQDLAVTVEYSKVARALVDAVLKGELRVEVRGEVRAKILLGLLEVSAPFTSTYSSRVTLTTSEIDSPQSLCIVDVGFRDNRVI